MSIVGRFTSIRCPYRRGGLVFDRSCKRNGAGEPVIEVTLEDCERLGPANVQELLSDRSNIRFEAVGPHSEGLAAGEDPLLDPLPLPQTGVLTPAAVILPEGGAAGGDEKPPAAVVIPSDDGGPKAKAPAKVKAKATTRKAPKAKTTGPQ